MSGIYRPGQPVQRVTANAGNRRFVRGGILHRPTPTLSPLAKALLLAAVLTPGPIEPPAGEPAAAPAPRKGRGKGKGADDDL